VTLVRASKPPDPDDQTGLLGANVQFDARSGRIRFVAFGERFETIKDKNGKQQPITIDGNSMHGLTFPLIREFRGIQRIGRAFIFVPAAPRIQGAKGRLVGDPVRSVIAIHELIHACGLDNSEHSQFSSAVLDVFNSPFEIQAGGQPADDRLHPFGFPNTLFPPIVIASPTVNLIQANWR
jgi:hypothetical protein